MTATAGCSGIDLDLREAAAPSARPGPEMMRAREGGGMKRQAVASSARPGPEVLRWERRASEVVE